MWQGLIISRLRPLIVVVLCSLFAMPASAHQEHDRVTSAAYAPLRIDPIAEVGGIRHNGDWAIVASASNSPGPASGCCCPPCSSLQACGFRMVCGSGACGVIAASDAPRLPSPAVSAYFLISHQNRAGRVPGPGDKPPRV